MTAERAVKGLKKLFSECELDLPETDSLEVLHIAINAMNKQVPKKPRKYKGYCGQCSCTAVFLDKATKYCGNCGQKLDWSDTD